MDRGGCDMPTLTAPPSRIVRRQPKKHVGILRWAKRGLKAAIVIAAGGVLGMSWRSGRLQVVLDQLAAKSLALSVTGGFRVEQVDVVGRDQTDPKALLAAAGLQGGA